jgi:DNA-directed RNA polymerase subunit RPC12/RpoP
VTSSWLESPSLIKCFKEEIAMTVPSEAKITCPYCHGTREVGPAHDSYVCTWCGGTGEISAKAKIDSESIHWLRINGAKTRADDAAATAAAEKRQRTGKKA